jgi:molecular chaperone GrpE (heat shock protein)
MIGMPPAGAETPTMVGGVDRASVESYLQAARLAQDRIAEVTAAITALKAENETFRIQVEKRISRQFEEGRESLLLSSVQTLESLDDAIQSAREGGAAEGLIQGVLLVRSQLFRLLQEEGLQRISVLGLPFDPATSEVVRTLPVDEEGQDGLVVEEVRSGQQLHGRVVRKARVVVGELMTIVDEEEMPAPAAEPTQSMPIVADEASEDHTIVRPPPFDAREVGDVDEEDEPEEAAGEAATAAEEEEPERTDATTVMAAVDVSGDEADQADEEEAESTVVRSYPMTPSEAEEAEEPTDRTVVRPLPAAAAAEAEAEEEPPAEEEEPPPPVARPSAAAPPPLAPPPEVPAPRATAPAPRLPERPRAPEPPPPTSSARAPRPAAAEDLEEARPAGKGGRGLLVVAAIVLLGIAAFAATVLVGRARSRKATTASTATVPGGPVATTASGEAAPGPAPVEESITVVVPTIPTDVVIVPAAPSTVAAPPTLPTAPLRTVPTPPPTTLNPAPALVAQADRAMAGANYEEALRLYEQAAQADPRNAEAAAGRTRATTFRDLAKRTFTGGATSVQTESSGKGPAGFDTSDVKVTKPAKNSGKIDFEVSPRVPLPGQPYTIAIYLTNTGSKPFKVEEVRAGMTVNGQGAPKPQTPKVKEVAPNQRTLVAEVSDQWKDPTMSWSFSATVTAPGAERFTSKLTWK